MPVCRAQLLWVVVVGLLAACSATVGADAPSAADGAAAGSSQPVAPRVGDGLDATLVTDGLDGPTQMTRGPDGRLWVAQLAGGENAGRGQVVAVDDDGDVEVMLTDLDKPTGLAWLDGAWWIQTPEALLRADGERPAPPEAVVDGLPNNGRSNGTLTPTADGTLLFETSGRERDGGAVDGSGILWELDPDRPDAPRPLATGLKNAYAHVRVGETLWSTEVAESIGGVAAPDELVRIDESADHGWPACVGDRVPVERFGGDATRCRDTRRPDVTFPVGATPTSIVADPFGDGLLVALWTTGTVVAVAPGDDGSAPIEVTDDAAVITGLPTPQHLLVDGDALLVSDHRTGQVWRISATAGS